MRDGERRAIEALDGQFGRGPRNVAVDAADGDGVLTALLGHLAARIARGQRCLVLHPMPRLRLLDIGFRLPGVTVGPLGSGSAVEVAGYRAAERAFADDLRLRSQHGFDVVLLEECQDGDSARAKAVRDAFPEADALLVGRPAPRAICALDAVVVLGTAVGRPEVVEIRHLPR